MTLVIYSSTFSSSINQRYGDSTIGDKQTKNFIQQSLCLSGYLQQQNKHATTIAFL